VKILNTIENGSLTPHVLDFKIGAPIMMIKNIDPAAGIICNGKRLAVTSLGANTVEAVIATGSYADDVALIRKIKFISLATEGISPFGFTRIQFPVRFAFAMTMKKAQGQTLDSAGLSLPCHVFGHGQLYVALSRVRAPEGIKTVVKRR